MAEILNENNFNEKVLESDGVVLVDFFATWCGPCQALAPIIDELAEERDDVKIYKVDVDKSMNVAGQYNVRSIPTLAFFKDGELRHINIGSLPKDAIEDKLDQYI